MAETSSEQLEVRTSDGIAVVTLSNPSRANALSNQTVGIDLPRLLTDLGGDEDVRVVVLTGAGSAFCSGTELDADGFAATDPRDTIALLRRAHRCVAILRAMRKPSVAAVNGAAIGAGLGLALACDLRIAAPTARFGVPYVRMGLTPDMGTSGLLPEIVGTAHALELMLTGRIIDADTAVAIGLVSRVVDDPLAAAVALAAEIAAHAPGAVAASRALVRDAQRHGLEWTLGTAEPHAFAGAFHDTRFQEQFAAYRATLTARNSDGGRRDGS